LLLTLIVGLPLRFIKKISKNLGAVPSTKENNIMKQFKVIVEKHLDGYVAYPLGFKGIIVGEGDTYEEVTYTGSLCSRSGSSHLMTKFPVYAPKRRVIKAFELLGFRLVLERENIAMVRENPHFDRIF